MNNKITTVTIQIPYKSAGGVIHQHYTSFDVYQTAEQYTLRPCLNPDELRLANLPEELHFVIKNGKPVSLRGIKDGNLHVIEDAVAAMKGNKVIE